MLDGGEPSLAAKGDKGDDGDGESATEGYGKPVARDQCKQHDEEVAHELQRDGPERAVDGGNGEGGVTEGIERAVVGIEEEIAERLGVLLELEEFGEGLVSDPRCHDEHGDEKCNGHGGPEAQDAALEETGDGGVGPPACGDEVAADDEEHHDRKRAEAYAGDQGGLRTAGHGEHVGVEHHEGGEEPERGEVVTGVCGGHGPHLTARPVVKPALQTLLVAFFRVYTASPEKLCGREHRLVAHGLAGLAEL